MDMSFFTGDGFMAFLKSMAFGGGLGLYALARQKEMERKESETPEHWKMERPEDLLFWPEPEKHAPVETASAPAWSYGPEEKGDLLEKLEAAVRKQERLEASLRRVAKTARKRARNKRLHISGIVERVKETARKRARKKRERPYGLRPYPLAMLASQGMTQKEIAEDFGISPAHVRALCDIHGIRTKGRWGRP